MLIQRDACLTFWRGGGGRGLLGRRCLLECGHREIRYTSVNPNFFFR